MSYQKKFIFLFLVLIIINFCFSKTAFASFCRNYNQDKICILDIKRSAKYYWRYRVNLSVNGVKKPLTIYDCRQKVKIDKNGSTIPFYEDGIESFVCKTLNK